MALITWNDTLSVNVREIDLQHQKLIGMLNDLHDAMLQGKGADVLGNIVSGLIEYTTTHFKTEEKYFDQFRYLEAGSHKREHADFVKKVSEFKTGLDKGSMSLTFEVMQFLSNWLKNHIMINDKKYVKLFNEKGLK